MTLTSANPLCKKLVEALHLQGQNVTGITLTFRVNEQVTATVERYITKEEADAVIDLLQDVQPVIVEKQQ
jgi:hypothetical protein